MIQDTRDVPSAEIEVKNWDGTSFDFSAASLTTGYLWWKTGNISLADGATL
jgi:hypothetical protein